MCTYTYVRTYTCTYLPIWYNVTSQLSDWIRAHRYQWYVRRHNFLIGKGHTCALRTTFPCTYVRTYVMSPTVPHGTMVHVYQWYNGTYTSTVPFGTPHGTRGRTSWYTCTYKYNTIAISQKRLPWYSSNSSTYTCTYVVSPLHLSACISSRF